MSRVTVETRKAYTIVIGGKKRRFWTEGAAYYKLARALLGKKYLAPFKAYETGVGSTPESVAEDQGISVDLVQQRADRASILFCSPGSYNPEEGYTPDYFDSVRWQKYVRRVANKMRALDAARERREAP